MIHRRILIATAFFLLGVLVYFIDLRMESSRADKVQEQKRVILLSAQEITSFTIINSFGSVAFKKEGNAWTITSPVATLADPAVVQAIIGNLSGAIKHYEFAMENEGDWATYGLDKPGIQIKVEGAFAKVPGSKEYYHLFIGKSSTTGQYYASLNGQKTAFAVSGYLRNQINQSLYNIRDKHIIYNNISEINILIIENPQSRMTVAKDADGNWSVTQPIQQVADKKYLDSLLSLMDGGRILKFGDKATSSISLLGLDPPAMRLTVESAVLGISSATAVSAASTITILRVGNYDRQSQTFWAMHEGSPEIFQIPSNGFDEMRALAPKDLRSRSLLSFSIPSAKKIEAKSGNSSFFIDQDAFGAWRFRDTPKVLVDQKKVYKLLMDLKNLEVSQFIADNPPLEELQTCQLAPPKREILLYSMEGKEIGHLSLGKLYEEKNMRFFALSGETSSVVTVSLSAGQQFILSKDSLADHRILPNASQIKAGKIELQVGKSAGVMNLRSDKKWMFQRTEETGAAQGYIVTENKIESLLYALSAIESKTSITSGSVTAERADIEHPAIRLGIWDSPESLAPQYRISIGSMTTSGNASVMRIESSAGDSYHVIAIEEADTLLSAIESVFK